MRVPFVFYRIITYVNKLKKRFKLIPLMVLLFIGGCATTHSTLCDHENAPRDSFVKILVETPMGDSSGSGAIIKHSNNHSLILTAGHVCVENSKISVIDTDGKKFETYIVRIAEEYDICLLATKERLKRYAIPISMFSPSRGEAAYNLAAPHGIHDKHMVLMFHGHYSGKIKIGGQQHPLDVFTIPTAGGSSGSPIFNSNWEIVGLVSMGYRSFENIALSVPHKAIVAFLNPDFQDVLHSPEDYITPPLK